MEKTDHKSNGGYAWAERSLLPGGISPLIDDDDDLVSVSELFARVDPAPTTATATTISAAGTHKRQISEAIPQDERPNKPETIPAAPPQQQASAAGGGGQETDEGAGTGARKSGRARNPKRRN